jgi:hypothetical protein
MPSRGDTMSVSPDSEQLKASTRLYQLADEARTEQLKASTRLYQLADEARTERAQWSDRMTTVRRELAHLADQLEEAARRALTTDEDTSDIWAEEGIKSIRRYRGIREFGANVYRHPTRPDA